jgi:hypothetical protein
VTVASTESRNFTYNAAMQRQMVWIEEARFEGWGCSDCGWLFNPSGAPAGNSLEEMKRNFELQRDKEFQSHLCIEHPRARTLER